MIFVPLMLREANDFVERHHRHSARTSNDGGKFAIGVQHNGELVGVAITGRPVARLLQDGGTLEILRCCVSPAAPSGTPSALYQRCARIWQLMGGKRVVTYTLKAEGGESMRNLANRSPDFIGPPERHWWRAVADVPGRRQWDTPSRPRKQADIFELAKTRHERLL